MINPNDEWRDPALAATASLHDAVLVTTDSVLVEVLNFFAERGDEARLRTVSVVEELLTNAHTEVMPQNRENFLAGLALYKGRADKGYSLTDCISMTAINITEVLTHDRHFRQEGFDALF